MGNVFFVGVELFYLFKYLYDYGGVNYVVVYIIGYSFGVYIVGLVGYLFISIGWIIGMVLLII